MNVYKIKIYIQFIKEVTIRTYALHKIPDGPFHGSNLQGKMVFEWLKNLDGIRQKGWVIFG